MRRRIPAALILLALVGAAVVVLDRVFPPDLSRYHAAGVEVLDRDGRTLSVLPAPGGMWRLRTTAGDVPAHLREMLIAAEDRRFRSHPGVDPLALARAAAQWATTGRVVSGGSTLTMQAARLLEPRPRTLRSKAIEIARALQLEARFTKDEILGIWLTLAPQGAIWKGSGRARWRGSGARRRRSMPRIRHCSSRSRGGRRRCGPTAMRMPRGARAMPCCWPAHRAPGR